MDKISKFIKKLSDKECVKSEQIVSRILSGDINGLDIKKLKGHNNLFRVRAGNIRVIFKKEKDSVNIITIDRRNDGTYSGI